MASRTESESGAVWVWLELALQKAKRSNASVPEHQDQWVRSLEVRLGTDAASSSEDEEGS